MEFGICTLPPGRSAQQPVCRSYHPNCKRSSVCTIGAASMVGDSTQLSQRGRSLDVQEAGDQGPEVCAAKSSPRRSRKPKAKRPSKVSQEAEGRRRRSLKLEGDGGLPGPRRVGTVSPIVAWVTQQLAKILLPYLALPSVLQRKIKSIKQTFWTTPFRACSICHIQGGVLCSFLKCCVAVPHLRLLFQRPSNCPGEWPNEALRRRPFFPFRCLQQISVGCLLRYHRPEDIGSI